MEFNSSITKRLTTQQIEVAKLLVLGNTADQIASKIYISKNTVKIHLRDIYERIHAKNAAHAGYILGLRTIKKRNKCKRKSAFNKNTGFLRLRNN